MNRDMDMERLTVLSLEQALSLSYATQRFVHLGWRVIRIEAAPSGKRLPGDPNRYVGKEGDRPDLHSYFIGPNVGKETISLNLKEKEGREVLRRLVKELPADVFCSNTLPKRYEELGIGYEALSAENPGLIWAGISAMGPEYPDVPGYDPVLQGTVGAMDITGSPDGPPMLSGIPFVDLKAGDEVFANVCLALAKRERTKKGSRIDVSMAQAAASWLLTTIPLLDLGYDPAEVKRSGNEHREFVPVNVYPTSDGYVYIAIGNDVQWARLTGIDAFEALGKPDRETNSGRKADRQAIHEELAAAAKGFETGALAGMLSGKGIVASPIHTIPQVLDFPPVKEKLLKTRTPSGKLVRLPPPSVERDHLVSKDRSLDYAPAYGEHTDSVLEDAGYSDAQIEKLRVGNIVA